jgi:hypothetical protein
MEKEIIENAYSKLGRSYKLETTAELNLASPIKKLYFLRKIDTFFSLETNCNTVKLYNPDFS